MKIKPAGMIEGEIEMPGDKSISHRAAMIVSIASGDTLIRNFATSADCASTLDCLTKLGVRIDRNGQTVRIGGVGVRGFTKPDGPLDCGNSGTTMRLLAGILAGQDFEATLTGDESLSKRPMRRVIEPLEAMGARIEAFDGHAPIKIAGTKDLKGTAFEPPVASAQLKSCVLLAGLNAAGQTTVLEKAPTRDHTERMLRWFGVDVEQKDTEHGTLLSISGGQTLTAKDICVPGDISSSAFFMAAAACLDDSKLVIKGVGLNPSRTAIINVLRGLGAQIEVIDRREDSNEPVGDLHITGKKVLTRVNGSNRIDGPVIANLIDEIPILAVFGTQVDGGLEIRDAAELRVKESDRIKAVVENLRRMGAVVEEFDDGLRVGRSQLRGAVLDSFNDHRIAMAFAVAGLFSTGETEIRGAECVNISFPGFFDVLAGAVQ